MARYVVRSKTGTVTTEQLTDELLAKLNEIRAGLLGESNWYERVEELGRIGALRDVYQMGACLGYLHADIRCTIWAGAVEAMS
jgi:hypothetical protein